MMSKIQNIHYKRTGDSSAESGRGTNGQIGWYSLASTFCKDKRVLDVGCGMGQGLNILAKNAKDARGIDLDERLKRSDIEIKDISEIETKSVDVVTAIDVIEHVEEDEAFVQQLVRIARDSIFVSTPNWTAGRCRWPYHIREYMPHELYNLFKNIGKIEMYKGTSSGDSTFRIKHIYPFFILNRLRIHWITGFITRCLNYFLPPSMKIHSHLFIRVIIRNEN